MELCARRFRPGIRRWSIAQAGDIDLHSNGVLEIRGEQYEDWARVEVRQIDGVNKVVVDLFSAPERQRPGQHLAE